LALYFSFYIGSVFFLICSPDRYFKKISNEIVFFLVIIILLLFAGFRYGIATDYWSYYNLFNEKEGIQRIEPGFAFLIKTYKAIFFSKSYNGFVFLISFLSIIIKYLFFRKLRNPFFALLFYISLFYISLEYNVIRQGLACSIICHAIDFSRKKNVFLFSFFIIVAATIHISSLVFLPLYFLCVKKIRAKIQTVIIVILLAMFTRLFLLDFLLSVMTFIIGLRTSAMASQLTAYLIPVDFTITLGFIRRVVIILLFLLLNNKKPVDNCFFNLYLIGFFIYILFMGNDILAYRACLSFDIFVMPLFADLRIKYTEKNIISTIVLIIILFVTYWSSLMDGYELPYRTYLFNTAL
jgi:hypothetical protein